MMTIRRLQALWRALESRLDPGAGPRPDPEDPRAQAAAASSASSRLGTGRADATRRETV